MSGQQIGTVVGGVVGGIIGFYAGGNVYEGVQIGMSAGGIIGGAVDPTKIYGPHVGDGQAQSATDGSPISWVMGTAWIAGTIVDLGASREFAVKQQGGKGSGTVQYNYEEHQNFSILVCESDALKGSTVQNVLMIEQDGKIVYDLRPSSTIVADSQKYMARNFRLYYGPEDQMPLSDYDGDHGVGNEPAYRGVLLAFFTQFNKTAVGGRIPNFRFLVSNNAYGTSINYDDDWKYKSVASADAGDQYAAVDYDDSAWATAPGAFGDEAAAGWTINTTVHSDARGAQIWLRRTLPKSNNNPVFNGVWNDVIEIWFNGVKLFSQTGGGPDIGALDVKEGGLLAISCTDAPGAVGSLGTILGVNIVYSDADVYPSLDSIVSGICKRGGLSAAQIDVSELSSQTVAGYTVAKQMNAVNALGPLLGAYFAYASEYDGKINFHFYGADAVMTIDEDDILEANDANNGNITANLRNNATEFPKKITGQYYDPAQNYMPVTVMQTRRAAGVTATGDITLDIPVAMPADQAQQTVDKALKVAYAQLEGTMEFSVPFAGPVNVYLSLVAGDPVLFRGQRWIIMEAIVSAGYIKLTLQYDRQSAYTSAVQAIPGLEPTAPQSRYSGPTTLYPMNLPSLRPQDTYGIYLAAKGTNDQASWRGCNVQVSYDGQVSWQNAITITLASVLGTVTAAEPTGGEPLTVNVGAGTLESITADQLAANMNAFALINGNTAEIGQFQNAAQQTDGTWQLTDISRGLLGTTRSAATVDQQFTMLDSVYFLPVDTSFAGKTLYLRAVGFGEDSSDATIVPIVFEAIQPRDFTIYGRITTDGSARVDTDNDWRTLTL